MSYRYAILLLLVSTTLIGCQPVVKSDQQHTIHVTGHAVTAVAPNQAHITFNIEQEGADLSELKQHIDETTTAILSALRDHHVADDDITSYNIQRSEELRVGKEVNYVCSAFAYVGNQSIE